MINRYFCMAAALIIGCTVGCRSALNSADEKKSEQPRITEIEVNEFAKVAVQGRQIGDKLLQALQTGQFELVNDLAIGNDKNKFTRDRFDNLLKNLQKGGGIKEFAYLGDLNMKPYRRLLWKVSFNGQQAAKDAGGDMLFEILIARINGEYRAVAFGFRP